MNEVFVDILGFLTIIAIVVTLLKNKTLPSITFILFPSVLALVLVLGSYYTFGGVASLIEEGFKSAGPTAALSVFSVLFFGIMTDAGMFGIVVDQLMKLVGDNVIGVTVMTAIIAMIAHIDGASTATFLIVILAMLPVYKKMHICATSLLRITVLIMGVLDLIPQTDPIMRATSVLGMEAGKLWNELLSIQVFGVILALGHAVLTGFQERAHGAGLDGKLAQTEGKVKITATRKTKVRELARPKLFIFNILPTAAVIVMLIQDMFPSYVPFMLGVDTSILVNYTDIKFQKKVLDTHAVPVLLIYATLIGAAVLMDILIKNVEVDGTEIPSVVNYMPNLISMILPVAFDTHLPLVIGPLSVSLALAFDTDSYFYGMLPVMMSIGQGFGVPALPITVSMVVCRDCATFINPMVLTTLLGVGLTEVDIKDHIRTNFFCVWDFSFLCMIFATVIDIISA